MSLKTYELALASGKVVQLRLTSRGIKSFEEKHGIKGAAPLVNVMNAVNSTEAMIGLLTTALKFPGAPSQMQDGADLIDQLADEGKGESFLRCLVVRLAVDSGLLEEERFEAMNAAMQANHDGIVETIGKLLRNEDVDSEEDGENPT